MVQPKPSTMDEDMELHDEQVEENTRKRKFSNSEQSSNLFGKRAFLYPPEPIDMNNNMQQFPGYTVPEEIDTFVRGILQVISTLNPSNQAKAKLRILSTLIDMQKEELI